MGQSCCSSSKEHVDDHQISGQEDHCRTVSNIEPAQQTTNLYDDRIKKIDDSDEEIGENGDVGENDDCKSAMTYTSVKRAVPSNDDYLGQLDNESENSDNDGDDEGEFDYLKQLNLQTKVSHLTSTSVMNAVNIVKGASGITAERNSSLKHTIIKAMASEMQKSAVHPIRQHQE